MVIYHVRYSLLQHIQMALEGNLVLLDWLTAGRIARGEVWQFNRWTTSTQYIIQSGQRNYYYFDVVKQNLIR